MKTKETAGARCIVQYLLIVARSRKRSSVREILRTACIRQTDTNHFAGDQILERVQITPAHSFELIEVDKHCLRYFGQIIFIIRIDKTGGKIGAQFGWQQVVDECCFSDILYLAA